MLTIDKTCTFWSAAPVSTLSASAPAASAISSLEMDLFGSDSIGSLALVPMTTTLTADTADDNAASIDSGFEANSFASMSTPAAASSPFDQVSFHTSANMDYQGTVWFLQLACVSFLFHENAVDNV
jgi:hypothetical protein